MRADFPAGRSYRRSGDTPWQAILIGVVVLIMLLLGVYRVVTNLTTYDTYKGCVVESKDRTKDSDGQSDARVYTTNCGVFQVKDTLIGSVNTRSGDLYGSIKVGTTYDFDTRGVRRGWPMTSFPLILKATVVS